MDYPELDQCPKIVAAIYYTADTPEHLEAGAFHAAELMKRKGHVPLGYVKEAGSEEGTMRIVFYGAMTKVEAE